MSNERLRALMAERNVTVNALSEHIGVDPKTVERWITKGRVPHRTHRLNVAAMLGKDDVYLWPESVSERQVTAASAAELVALFPSRGAVPTGLWSSLIDDAVESVDLLAFAASFMHDVIPDFHDRVSARAKAGVRVRLLFGDPESAAVQLRGEEEGIGDLLAARCRLTWSYCEPLISVPGVEARQHGSTLYNSVFRFDRTAMVNAHSWGTAASQSPVMHLQRVPGGRLFDHYMCSFERVWDAAHAVHSDATATAP